MFDRRCRLIGIVKFSNNINKDLIYYYHYKTCEDTCELAHAGEIANHEHLLASLVTKRFHTYKNALSISLGSLITSKN